jgi:hypothetical protein
MKHIVNINKYSFTAEDIKPALEKHQIYVLRIIMSKKHATSELFQHALKHFTNTHFETIFDQFVSLGFKLGREDLKEFMLKEWSGPGFSTVSDFKKMLEKVLKNTDFPANDTDIEWAVSKDSHSHLYTYSCLPALKRMLELAKNIPSSAVFQEALGSYFSPELVDLFLKKGYQITSSDFRYVFERVMADNQRKGWECYVSDPDPQVLDQLVCKGEFQISFTKKYRGGAYKLTREDFHFLLQNKAPKSLIRKYVEQGNKITEEDLGIARQHCSDSIMDYLMENKK